MTYLELVNSVLRRLRENQVDTVAETSYSVLIGDFVNDSKQIVEDSHSWSALRTAIEFNTVSGTSVYALTGSGQDVEVREALNITSKLQLNARNRSYMNKYYRIGEPASGAPNEFAFNGTDDNGDITVQVYPQPNDIFTIYFDSFVRQADLTEDATRLKVPHNPVLQLALAMALRERGETGGQSAAEQFAIADTVLSDAVAFDANKYGEDTTYIAV
tara:strand:- start:1504 stop:2151 length:648 start_codon:yes stop_codon:yes gene_type:complete